MKHNFFYLNDFVLILLPNNRNRIPSVLSPREILKVQKAFVICASTDFIETFNCSAISLFLFYTIKRITSKKHFIFALDLISTFIVLYLINNGTYTLGIRNMCWSTIASTFGNRGYWRIGVCPAAFINCITNYLKSYKGIK